MSRAQVSSPKARQRHQQTLHFGNLDKDGQQKEQFSNVKLQKLTRCSTTAAENTGHGGPSVQLLECTLAALDNDRQRSLLRPCSDGVRWHPGNLAALGARFPGIEGPCPQSKGARGV